MEVIVQLTLVEELWMLSGSILEFNSDFEVGLGIDALIDLPESPFSYFFDYLKILANFLREVGHVINIIIFLNIL